MSVTLERSDSSMSERHKTDVIHAAFAAFESNRGCVRLCSKGIGDEHMGLVCEYIRRYRDGLEVLDLSHNPGISAGGAIDLGLELELADKLRMLDLSADSISDAGAVGLARILKNSLSLETLSFRGNNISSFGLRRLLRELRDAANLRTLDLSGNAVDDACAEEIGAALRDVECLTTLHLGSAQLTATGARALGKTLKQSPSLQDIDLANCGELRDEGIAILARELASAPVLEKLNLCACGLSDEGAVLLSELLPRFRSLKALYLANNAVGDRGAEALAKVLADAATFRTLDLHGNEVCPSGAAGLAAAFRMNPSLRELDVGANPIGDIGALHIVRDVACTSDALATLKFSVRQLTPAGQTRVAEALCEHPPAALASLAGIDLRDHAEFIGLPQELRSADNAQILRFFRENHGASAAQVIATKVMVLGPAQSGKTALVRRLARGGAGGRARRESSRRSIASVASSADGRRDSQKRRSRRLEAATMGGRQRMGRRGSPSGGRKRGMSVERYSDPEVRDLELVFYDFGEQEIYESVQSLLLRACDVFLVVWRPEQGDFERAAFHAYAAQALRASPSAAIVFVTTFADHSSVAPLSDRQLQMLCRRYENNFAGYHHVTTSRSARKRGVPSGLGLLLRELVAVADCAEHLEPPVHHSLGTLKDRIQGLREVSDAQPPLALNMREWTALASEAGLVGEDAARDALELLNSWGEVLRIPHEERAGSDLPFIVLSPPRFAQVLSKVLRDDLATLPPAHVREVQAIMQLQPVTAN